MKCIDGEIPFEIPQGWEWARWGNISQSIQYGYNAPAEAVGDIRMVRISDIQENIVLWHSVPFCHINENEIENYLLQPNDILFARTGGTVGKSFLVSEVPYPAIYAGYLIRTRYSKYLNPYYLKSFMDSDLYWAQLRNGTIATAQPNCNGKTLSQMILPIPPEGEQGRMIEKIQQLLPIINRYGESQDKLNRLNSSINKFLKKSILQEAIQGKLVPQIESEGTAAELLEQIQKEKKQLVKEGKLKRSALNDSVIFKNDDNKYFENMNNNTVEITEEIPFDIPETWNWVRLGTIFKHNTGKALNASNKEGELLKYITTSNLYWNRFELENIRSMPFTQEELNRCTVTKGDLLVCEGGDVGRAAIWNYDYDIRIQNHIHKLRSYFDQCTDFFYYVLFLYKSVGLIGGKGIGIQGLSSGTLDKLLIPLPPVDEQKRIVKEIHKLTSTLRR